MLKFCLLLWTVLYEILDFFDFIGYLHHSKIVYLLCSFYSSPLQIFSKSDDYGMETHSKKKLSFEVIFDFHNHEAMFLGDAFLKSQRTNIVLDFALIKIPHTYQINFGIQVMRLSCAFLQLFLLVCFQQLFSPSNIHKGFAIDLSSLFLR